MGDFEHRDQDGARHKLGDVFRDPPSTLPQLLQRKIEKVQIEEGALNLILDDGQELNFTATDLGENGLIKFSDDFADGWIVF